jgi:hypothetical protein
MKYHETDLYGTLLEQLSHKGASAVIAELGYDVPAGKGKHNERSLAVLATLKDMTVDELTAWVAAKTEKRRAANPLTMTVEELQKHAEKHQAEWDTKWAAMTQDERDAYMADAQRHAAEVEYQEAHWHHSTHTV